MAASAKALSGGLRVELRTITDTHAVIVVEGVDASFVNALRRTLVANVPKLAIEDVTVYDNTSALFDETIAHRLGLLPIPTDLQLLNFREQCTCKGEGCPSCTVIFTLSKEGPCTVLSGDLQPTDRKWAIKDDKIPIVKLMSGQRLMLEATAILGTSAQHAKWQVATGVGYKNYPKIELLSEECNEGGACAKIAPDVLKYENGRVRIVNAEAYKFDADALKACSDHIRVKLLDDKWIMTVETDGALTAKDALTRALAILKEKLKSLETGIGTLDAEAKAAQ